jgi:hypothetical protein
LRKLGALGDLLDLADEGPDPLSALVGFFEDLLRNGDDSFSPTQIHDDVAAFEPLHESVGQFPFFYVVFLVDIVPFRVLHPLDDNLFGRLNGNPAEGARVDLDAETVPRFRFLIEGASCLRDRDMKVGIQNLFHHHFKLEDFDLAGFLVVVGFQLDIGSQFLASRRQHGILQGLDDNHPVDPAILAHLFDQAFEFGKHSINLRYHSVVMGHRSGVTGGRKKPLILCP